MNETLQTVYAQIDRCNELLDIAEHQLQSSPALAQKTLETERMLRQQTLIVLEEMRAES